MAPLAGVGVEERGRVHLPRRTMPVEGEGQRCPAGLRPQLFLADVVRPATTRLADTAAHHQQVHDAAVDHVVVVPVVQRRAEDDHRLAVGLVGVVGEFARHRDDVGARHAAMLLGPGRGIGHVVVVAGRDVRSAEAAVDAVVGEREVVDGGDAHVLAADADDLDRQLAGQQFVVVIATEVGEGHLDNFVVAAEQGQLRLHFLAGIAVAHLEVPGTGLPPAEPDRAVGRHQIAGVLVEDHGLPFGIVVLSQIAGEVGGAQVAVGDQLAFMLLEHHQHGMVVVLAAVAVEILAFVLVVELAQDDVTHRQRQRGVGALPGRQPDVAELDHLAEVGRDRHGLGALVANLGVEVGVRGTGLRHVGAPHHQVGRVVPVGRFRHVGLLAPHLRACGWKVAVPVVEGAAYAAYQRHVARTRRVAHHRHGRNRREAVDAVGAEFLDREYVGGGDDLGHLVPFGAHETALAAHRLVALGLLGVLANRAPGLHRIHRLARLAPHFHQAAADQRIFDALRRIHVPGVAGTPRAAARFMVGQVGTGARIVGLLDFPGDQAVLDENLPAARAGAVHPVGGAHHLVLLPAAAIGVFPAAVFVADHAVAVGITGDVLLEEVQSVDEVTHCVAPCSRSR